MESLNKMKSRIEIMDSTLRDGEQTNGVSFLPHEKLMIARLLLEELFGLALPPAVTRWARRA